MKNMKIGKRLLLAFVVSVLFSSVAGAVGIVLLNRTNNAYSAALDNYGFTLGDIGRLGMDFQEHRAKLLYLLQETDTSKRVTARQELKKQVKRIEEDMEAVKACFPTEEGQKTYALLEQKVQAYADAREEVIRISDLSRQAAVDYFVTTGTPLAEDVGNMINQILEGKIQMGEAESVSLTTQSDRFELLMIVIIAGSILFSILVAALITRSITLPLKKLRSAAKELARGNLMNVNIDYRSKNEIGELAESMGETVQVLQGYIRDLSFGLHELANGNLAARPNVEFQGDFMELRDSLLHVFVKLNGIMLGINRVADEVSADANHVAEGAQNLSQGSTQQAATVQQLAATMNEVAEEIKGASAEAARASEESKTVEDDAGESNRRMQDMLDAIGRISESSGEIGKIIKTIEDIAFQTNILALNAAVEAARAGAAGKGFAVVADEVRNLASKSAEASKSTSALIEHSMSEVENGTRIAGETAQTLERVVAGIQKVSGTVDEISRDAMEQAQSIAKLTEGIGQISEVVQNNSATAEESAATSEELSGQAHILKGLVDQFVLLKESEAEPAAV